MPHRVRRVLAASIIAIAAVTAADAPADDPAIAPLLVPAGEDAAKAKTLVSGYTAQRVQLGRVTAEQWARMRGKIHEVPANRPFSVTYQFREGVGILIVPDPAGTWSSGPGKPPVHFAGSEDDQFGDYGRMALLISGNDSPFELVEGVPLTAGEGDVKLTLKANDDTLDDDTGSIRVKFIWVKAAP